MINLATLSLLTELLIRKTHEEKRENIKHYNIINFGPVWRH